MIDHKICFTIREFCAAAGIGRTTVYNEINAGRLKIVKVGKRTLIPAAAASRWIDGLAQTTGALSSPPRRS